MVHDNIAPMQLGLSARGGEPISTGPIAHVSHAFQILFFTIYLRVSLIQPAASSVIPLRHASAAVRLSFGYTLHKQTTPTGSSHLWFVSNGESSPHARHRTE